MMSKQSINYKWLLNPIHLLALGFGSGLAPKAPGTFGTVVSAIIYYFFLARLETVYYLLSVLAAVLMGIGICHYTAKALKVHDHPGIVWDEIAGYWITMVLAPPGMIYILIGFILFRFFDIVKPWPISWCDRKLKGGLGIMLDDILAGVFAFAGLQLTFYWLI